MRLEVDMGGRRERCCGRACRERCVDEAIWWAFCRLWVVIAYEASGDGVTDAEIDYQRELDAEQ